jgi:siroheme synthase (precorrin-2 oxidase/ferrochelatase)
MLDAIEDNILEPRIDDLIKEFSRQYHTDSLMADGGQLLFEKALEVEVAKEFEEVGFELRTFQAQLTFTEKVSNKIDNRNEVDANITVLESKIMEQRKMNELEALKTEQAIIKSRGLTDEILQDKAIEKWDGKLNGTYVGKDNVPFIIGGK